MLLYKEVESNFRLTSEMIIGYNDYIDIVLNNYSHKISFVKSDRIPIRYINSTKSYCISNANTKKHLGYLYLMEDEYYLWSGSNINNSNRYIIDGRDGLNQFLENEIN